MTATDSSTPCEEAVAQAERLSWNAVDVLPQGGLAQKIDLAMREDRPLRVKLGIDPTTSDIHLGHCVVLKKLREFQDEGHHAVLIIGDYTARVGDPSQRSKARPMVSADQIERNALTYQEQAFRILREDRSEVVWNGEWLGSMQPSDLFRLMQQSTVARILERDDFSKRYSSGTPIVLLELLYPLLQGYDSVAVRADVELGGTDQLYNLLMGREVMPNYHLDPQAVLTVPILVGTDGEQKMSKSLGNYVGVTESPEEMFGKTMSIPDAAMPEWIRYACDFSQQEAGRLIAELEAGLAHPNEVKRSIARSVVDRFHSEGAGVAAEDRFNAVFREHQIPDDIPECDISDASLNEAGMVFLPAFMVSHMGLTSNGEARRMIASGAVKLDGEPLAADQFEYTPSALSGCVLQVGKRKFLRIN